MRNKNRPRCAQRHAYESLCRRTLLLSDTLNFAISEETASVIILNVDAPGHVTIIVVHDLPIDPIGFPQTLPVLTLLAGHRLHSDPDIAVNTFSHTLGRVVVVGVVQEWQSESCVATSAVRSRK